MFDSKRLNIALENHVFKEKIQSSSVTINLTIDYDVNHEILFYGATPDIFNTDVTVSHELNRSLTKTDFIEITSTGWRKKVWKFLKSLFRR